MSNELSLKVMETTINEEQKFLCTFVSHDLIFKHGLIGSVIVGEVDKLDNGDFDFDSGFRANSLFKETIFNFVQNIMINDSGLIEAAKQQNEGWVHIIDQRTKTPQGEVPAYDIIGGFKVENKELKSFSENPNYQIRSENGFTNFGKSLNSKMNDFLENLLLKNA